MIFDRNIESLLFEFQYPTKTVFPHYNYTDSSIELLIYVSRDFRIRSSAKSIVTFWLWICQLLPWRSQTSDFIGMFYLLKIWSIIEFTKDLSGRYYSIIFSYTYKHTSSMTLENSNTFAIFSRPNSKCHVHSLQSNSC